MLEMGCGLDLSQEPFRTDYRREFGAQHFCGDLAVVTEVLGEVDDGHPARSQLPLDVVAVGERSLNSHQQVWQVGP